MRNVKMEVKGSILTVTIDLSQTFRRSKSGKTTIVASTDGNVQVAPGSDVKIGINAYK
jgi:hypothetical protein